MTSPPLHRAASSPPTPPDPTPTVPPPQARSGGPTHEDVHNVAFGKPPIGKRGYNEDEVDEFLDLVVAEMTRRGLT